jgi:hypothetical protein
MSDLSSLKKFASALRELPKVVAQKAAAAAAPAISAEATRTFDAGEDPYGITWAPSVLGEKVTLRKTGALLSNIRYVAIGTKMRVALGVRYAKYQIGKRPVFPRQGSALPVAYSTAIKTAVDSVIREELSK